MKLHGLLFALVFLFSLACAQNPIVDLNYARYRGLTLSSGVNQWLGIRYAAPPVGPLRFAAPQDPRPVEEIQYASKHGPICIPTGKYPIPQGASEDCLFLDVYAPAQTKRHSKLLPVYVWIQGGGYNENSQANYNGTGLIQASHMDIIVVTFNYRVGPYGFLSGEEVLGGGSLNNGLKDHIKVLQWVQKHISKFGGDPKRVVIGGASAGGASVTLLLSAYGGRDDHLFHGAAVESQSFAGMLTLDESQFLYNNLVIRTGCASDTDTLACLRRLDVASLQRQNIQTPLPSTQQAPLYLYGPTIDEDLVPDYTYRLFHQGKFIKVPVIFGDASDEGTVFVPKNTSSLGEADTFIQNQFPEIELHQFAKINKWYFTDDQLVPFPNAGHYWKATSNAYGEMRYICPGIDMSSIYEKAGVASWNFHYAVTDAQSEASGEGTTHTIERFAIWGPQYVPEKAPESYFTSNAPIVPVMQGYWTSFIKSLDPNLYRYPGSPEWKTWGKGDEYRRLLIRTGETSMESVPEAQTGRCKYLISIGPELGQ
ncbi:Alpha/Beta hydrolase protein [Aspergillus floccosus]